MGTVNRITPQMLYLIFSFDLLKNIVNFNNKNDQEGRQHLLQRQKQVKYSHSRGNSHQKKGKHRQQVNSHPGFLQR